MRINAVSLVATARCQISDESKDEEIQEKEKKGKKTSREEKTTQSLASLNSNYREDSSSESDSNERVSKISIVFHQGWNIKVNLTPVPVRIPIVCGGSEEVRSASGAQRCDDPVQGDKGQEGHGERHIPHVLPPPGEGGRQEGRQLRKIRIQSL